MANLPEVVNFDSVVYEIATGDQVIGGDQTAIANKQASALANRTQWLKAQITTIEDNQATDEANITALQSSVTAILARLTTDETQIATNTSNITSLFNKIFPAGGIIAWGISTPPANFLECAGQTVSRATYAGLFAAIGTAFGAGDGSTTFSVPDLRGEFIRGWSHGALIDSGRLLGTYQGDTYQDHTHNVVIPVATTPAGSGVDGRDHAAVGTVPTVTSSGSTPISGTGSPGTETRPTNMALMFIIKF